MKIYAVVNGVELGVSLNSEEVVELGTAFAEIFSSSDLTNSFMKSVNDIVNAAVNAAEPAEDKSEEKGPVKAEDLLDEEKEAAIQKLKDLGCSVKEKEEDVYECKTNSIWEDKYTLVKVWLKDHGIKYEERLNSCGRKVMYYDLCMTDLENMIDWLDDHGDKIDTTIEI